MKLMERANIKRMNIWGRIIGVGSMLYGVVSIVLSFYTSFWYVIPAIVSIFIGKLLYDIGHEAKKVLQSQEESISLVADLIKKYSRFLFVLGLIICVTIGCYLAFMGYIYIFF